MILYLKKIKENKRELKNCANIIRSKKKTQ